MVRCLLAGLFVIGVLGAISAQDIDAILADLQKGGLAVCQYCSYCQYRSYCSCSYDLCRACPYAYHCDSTCQGLCQVCANSGPCSTVANETCVETTNHTAYCIKPVDPICEQKGRDGSCDFYQCFDNRITCGSDGYAIGYGNRYCNKFNQNYSEFDSAGQKMIDCVRQCLTSALVNIYSKPDTRDIGCDYIKTYAFDSHVDCYANCGFCQTFLHNKLALWHVYEVKDFLSRIAINQVAKVGGRCITAVKDQVVQWAADLLAGLDPPFG